MQVKAFPVLGLAGAAAGIAMLLKSDDRETSRGDQAEPRTLERVAARTAARSPVASDSLWQPLERWPLPAELVTRIGDDSNVWRITDWHQGLDIYAPAGTIVVAPEDMTVLGSYNGMRSKEAAKRKAGLWVDARGKAGRILRFIHLASGSVRVHKGQVVAAGETIGEVAPTGDSGVFKSPPQLHFEVRRPDWTMGPDKVRINPALLLPLEGSPSVLRQLATLRKRHEATA